jgi:hypothetical protein
LQKRNNLLFSNYHSNDISIIQNSEKLVFFSYFLNYHSRKKSYSYINPFTHQNTKERGDQRKGEKNKSKKKDKKYI